MGYTTLTVLQGGSSLDEPVLSLPLLGRVSFRQAGIIMGLCVITPLCIHSALSGAVLAALPEPIASVGGARLGWDAAISLLPAVAGLVLGVPRPRLVPMDVAVLMLLRFAVTGTSIRARPGRRKVPRPRKSGRLGFAPPDPSLEGAPPTLVYRIGAQDPSVPKSLTITLYGEDGSPLSGKLARTYIDDELVGSVTTDGDGAMGVTFVPGRRGTRRLRIEVDGEPRPAVDAPLEISGGP